LNVHDNALQRSQAMKMDALLKNTAAVRDFAAMQTGAEALGPRLKRIRKLKGFNQEQVAEFVGVSREAITRWETGTNEPTEANIQKMSKLYSTPAVYLRYGGAGGPKTVQVLGHVGAGANVFPFEDGPFDQIEAPFGSPDDLAALIVRGDSMMPELSDGDHVLYRATEQNPDDLIGKRCIIRLESGSVLVKRLRRGRDIGCYDLDSTNAATIENQRLQWVAKVEAVKYR
jgi:transcriptional regulator with XRE-family HTH domain